MKKFFTLLFLISLTAPSFAQEKLKSAFIERSKSLDVKSIKKLLDFKGEQVPKNFKYLAIKDKLSDYSSNLIIKVDSKKGIITRPIMGGVCTGACNPSAFKLLFDKNLKLLSVESADGEYANFTMNGMFALKIYDPTSSTQHRELSTTEMQELADFINKHLELKEKSQYYQLVRQIQKRVKIL